MHDDLVLAMLGYQVDGMIRIVSSTILVCLILSQLGHLVYDIYHVGDISMIWYF